MYSRKKGKSGSKRPVKRETKSWGRYSDKEVEQLTIKLAKQGLSTSQIGIALRDAYGIHDVKAIAKKSISKILKENDLLFKVPEDISNLIRKTIKLMKHVDVHKHDFSVKRGLLITESKIRKLAKYYKRTGKLPQDWAYDRAKAKMLIE